MPAVSLGRGAITNTDMMTVGRGGYPGGKPGMSQGQYRIEVFLYAVLSSPMVLSFECACFNLHASETPLVLTRGSPDLVFKFGDCICLQPLHI